MYTKKKIHLLRARSEIFYTQIFLSFLLLFFSLPFPLSVRDGRNSSVEGMQESF